MEHSIVPLKIESDTDRNSERMSGPGFDYRFNLTVLGNGGVGKSSLILRFADNSFKSDGSVTIGVDFRSRLLDLDGQRVKLMVWDLAGYDRFNSILKSHCRSHGIVLAYDVTVRESFDSLPRWMSAIEQYGTGEASLFLVGNKCDMEERRVIRGSEGEDFARSLGIPFMETSAKDGTNVDEVFVKLASAILAKPPGTRATAQTVVQPEPGFLHQAWDSC
jgi:small GTP-binding protein